MSSSEKAVFAADTRAGATNQFTFKETKDGKKTTGSVTLEASSGIFVQWVAKEVMVWLEKRYTQRYILSIKCISNVLYSP